MAQLTDIKARRLRPGDRALAAGGVAGLYLFPSSQRGQGKWILRYVSPVSVKRRDMGLGKYPDVGIAAARKTAFEAREIIAAGKDPIEERRSKKMQRRTEAETPTFEMAARSVHSEVKAGFRNRKHADQWINTMVVYVFPHVGRKPVSALTPRDFAEALRPIWLSKPETASRVRQRCDTVMSWCAARRYVVASPLGIVSQLLPRQPGKRERQQHYPSVPWRDMPRFVRSVLDAGRRTAAKRMLELLILTGTRSGEIRGMQWDEIDLEIAIWTVPAERMKAKVAHRVPLSARALAILDEQRPFSGESVLVFPSRNGGMLSDITLTKILRDANVASDTPGRVATAHGFRSSFRDWASENHYPRNVAERALAHTISNAVEAAYHRTDLLDQRRAMMEEWASFLEGA